MSTIFKDPVEIGGLQFNNGPTNLGYSLRCDLLDGWDDTAEPENIVGSYGYSDGVVAADRFPLKEQYLEFGGYITARSELDLEIAKDTLKAALAPSMPLTIIRRGPIAKAMDVRVSGKVEFPQTLRSRTPIGDNAARFMVRLMAPWPYKFSPEEVREEAGVFVGGSYFRTYDKETMARAGTRTYEPEETTGDTIGDTIQINNQGNADAYPIAVVRGPLLAGSWELINETTGETQTFDVDLSTGAELEIDNRNKVARIGSQTVDYFLRGDWIRLAHGTNTLRLATAEPNPDARLIVRARHTWR